MSARTYRLKKSVTKRQKGVTDPFIFLYTICGILIVFSTWVIARRKSEFKISPAVTALNLVLIVLSAAIIAWEV